MAKLKIGDKVMWSGCWGSEEPKEATVISISKTTRPREKYGEDVDEVDWACNFTVCLDNGHWAYDTQLSRIIA
jgi:hypothetical protein